MFRRQSFFVMNGGARKVLFLCLCFMLSGFVMPMAAAQSNDILNRLGRLENELDTLNRAVYRGERPPASSFSSSNPASGNTEIRMQQLETEMRQLTGKIEQQAYDIQQLQSQLNNLQPPANNATTRAVPSQPPVSVYNQNPPSPAVSQANTQPFDYSYSAPSQDTSFAVGKRNSALQTGNAAAQYDQAFSFIKSGDYSAAQAAFQNFIGDHPSHTLAPNAQYWLGETHYVQGDYPTAARIFAESYQKYPGGPKAADSLLKLGMSLSSMGSKDDACVALNQLTREYPGGGPVLRRAEQEIQSLGCS